jgi:hypothetical protein
MLSQGIIETLKVPSNEGYDFDLAVQMPISMALLDTVDGQPYTEDPDALTQLIQNSRLTLEEILDAIHTRTQERELTDLENAWITKIIFLLSDEGREQFEKKITYLYNTHPSRNRLKVA